MLSIIEHYARYLNSYAYCFVALYGKDFRTAGREVQAMFDQRGWTAVINDDLVSKTLGVANPWGRCSDRLCRRVIDVFGIRR